MILPLERGMRVFIFLGSLLQAPTLSRGTWSSPLHIVADIGCFERLLIAIRDVW